MTLDDRDLCALSIADAGAALHDHRISSRELTEAHLRRIERLDPVLHAFVTVTADRARADAEAADHELARGRSRGALHGIPVTLKDNYDTAGIPTTAGSRAYAERIPREDSDVAAALREAGAVLLGKTKLHEFAMGRPHEGEADPPLNPWALDRSPGGSSSGSAAALAAGLCQGSFGSDTGGSLRTPAAFSGVVGFKPTTGLISMRGLIPLAPSFDVAGPMARTVRDAALLLDAVAGTMTERGLEAPLAGLRVGVPGELIVSHPGLEPAVLARFEAALLVLRSAGATVADIALPAMERAAEVLHVALLAEAQRALGHLMRDEALLGIGFRERMRSAAAQDPRAVERATEERQALATEAAKTMTEVDLIATPTKLTVAPTIAGHAAAKWGPFAELFNITGQPSLSVPCGRDEQGLPVGLLLSGRVGDDAGVLRAAHRYEVEAAWHRHFPLIAFYELSATAAP